jgi:SAM-dependent methyltransferase
MKKGIRWRLAQYLEFKWWSLYLRDKDPDEYIQWKTGYWLQLLEAVLPGKTIPSNQLILDAGCGPAGIFMALEGNRVEALDPLLDKYADLEHFKPGSFSWTKFKKMPLELLGEKEKYDMIFCMNAINHVDDVALCCRNLATALKSGGYLVISTDAHRYGFLENIFRRIPGDVLHPVQLGIDGYLSLLNGKSLHVVENILFKRGNIFNYYITIAQKRTGS